MAQKNFSTSNNFFPAMFGLLIFGINLNLADSNVLSWSQRSAANVVSEGRRGIAATKKMPGSDWKKFINSFQTNQLTTDQTQIITPDPLPVPSIITPEQTLTDSTAPVQSQIPNQGPSTTPTNTSTPSANGSNNSDSPIIQTPTKTTSAKIAQKAHTNSSASAVGSAAGFSPQQKLLASSILNLHSFESPYNYNYTLGVPVVAANRIKSYSLLLSALGILLISGFVESLVGLAKRIRNRFEGQLT